MCYNFMKHPLSLPIIIISALFRELIDAYVRISPHSGSRHKGGKKQLLIVRLDTIGDFVLFLDTFKEYRKLYPADEWEITLLGNHAWADLAKNLPYADRYWFVDCKKFYQSPFYRYRLLRAVREARFDTVIEPAFSRVYAIGDAVIRASGAAVRIGSAGELIGSIGSLTNIHAWQKRISDRWYTDLIPASDRPLTELERNAKFMRGLGLCDFQSSAPIYPDNALPKLPRQSPLLTDAPYFVIFPGAGLLMKQWPAERFGKVAKTLYDQTHWTPIICGGLGEELVAERVISVAQELPWMNLSGKTSLGQLARILSGAKAFIGNDSGAVHLAAAVGCPTICIMGGGHFGRFFPYGDLTKNRIVYKKMDCYGCNWMCKHTTTRCIEEIEVEDVIEEISAILESGSSKSTGPG